MGATLVAQAIMSWSHVSHQAFRALMKMAVTAKDQSTKEVPAKRYFAGHDGLVPALLFKPGTAHRSKLRAVRDAVAELEAAGAVECIEPAIAGSNAVYGLTLDAIPMPTKPRKKSKGFAKQAGDVAPTEAGTRPPTPYKEEEPLEEPLEELREDEASDLATDLAATRATSAEHDNPEIHPGKCANPACILGNVIDPTAAKGRRVVPCPQCRGGNVIAFPGRSTA